VSPFAAGCALCGAELDVDRHSRRGPRVALPSIGGSSPRGVDVAAFVLLVLLALFAPLFGLIVGGLRAWATEREGRTMQRNIAIVLAGVCVVFLIDPIASLDLLYRLGLP